MRLQKRSLAPLPARRRPSSPFGVEHGSHGHYAQTLMLREEGNFDLLRFKTFFIKTVP